MHKIQQKLSARAVLSPQKGHGSSRLWTEAWSWKRRAIAAGLGGRGTRYCQVLPGTARYCQVPQGGRTNMNQNSWMNPNGPMAQASCNWTENTCDANPMLRPLGPLGQLDKNYWTLLQTRPDKNAHSCSCLDSSWEQLKGMTIECLCFCAKQTQVDPPLQQTSANFGKVHSWAQVVATLCLRKCRRRGSLRMKTEWQALWVQLQMSDVELATTSITLVHDPLFWCVLHLHLGLSENRVLL